MLRKLAPWLLCCALATLVGCAGSNTGLERPLNSLGDTGPRSDGRTTPPMSPIYYNYDSAGIRVDQISALEYNAKYILNLDGNVRVEGNTDPRGTGEYNMALGQRRADAARAYLIRLGVDPNKLNAVSYGEENLKSLDRAEYVLDRRSDFVVE